MFTSIMMVMMATVLTVGTPKSTPEAMDYALEQIEIEMEQSIESYNDWYSQIIYWNSTVVGDDAILVEFWERDVYGSQRVYQIIVNTELESLIGDSWILHSEDGEVVNWLDY